MPVSTELDLRITCTETEAASGVQGEARRVYPWSKVVDIPTGTTAAKNDVCYAITATAAASADTYDLLGSLTSVLTGDAISFVDVVGFAIVNNSTATGEDLTVGAGSNPWITWLNATGDAVVVPPGGCLVWFAGLVDDTQPTAGTGDILTIDPGAATISYDLTIFGRSA